MASERHARIRDLFNAALAREPAQRTAFLAQACAGDPLLQEEVESLLAAYEEAPDFLESPGGKRSLALPQESAAHALELEPEPGLPFAQLGDFRLIRRIGEGGMGVVYLALQQPLGRQVALKIIRPEGRGLLEAETRFRREAEAIAGLRHPNIVTVFGSGEEQGVCYYAMELVSGRGLDQELRRAAERGEQVPLAQALEWIREIASALECAHRSGIIHRDVKPSNIRIAGDSRALLMDFGVARLGKLSAVTLTGVFRGTPHYASPEQIKARREEIDPRTDVYSLGVTLYEATAGHLPFEGETTEQVFRQILQDEPTPPRLLNSSISSDLEAVILKAIEKDPRRRYQTMADFAADLEELLAGKPVSAQPAGPLRKAAKWVRRHRFSGLVAATSFLVGVTLLALVVIVSAQRRDQWRSAAEKFKPVKAALEWPDLPRLFVRQWSHDVDPSDPFAHMMQAIMDIDTGDFKAAARDLDECIKRCEARQETSLNEDAHYLLALVRLGIAETYESGNSERSRLHHDAVLALQAAGEFRPTSKEALLWREPAPASLPSVRESLDIEKIKVNTEHFLVHLFLGIRGFRELYLGGTIGAFEEVIQHLEHVVTARPDNVIALTFLGRAIYFFAKFYNFLGLTQKAEHTLIRARTAAGEPRYFMIDNTLAAICLLRGNSNEALRHNNQALKLMGGKNPEHYHNVLGVLGKVLARQGRFTKAREKYQEALQTYQWDIPIRLALAELDLYLGDTGAAMANIEPLLGQEPVPAAVYGLHARVKLAQDEYAQALQEFSRLVRLPVSSPNEVALACLAMATLPEEELRQWPGLAGLSTELASKTSYNARFKGRDSPICLSALGAAAYLRGDYRAAISQFEQAIKERAAWPQDVLAYHWSESARDNYFMAMCCFELARAGDGDDTDESAARQHFEEAEHAYLENAPPIETADIIRRVREKARLLLNR
ncbi:MAG: protein kinase [Planctomycetota bacterium]